MGEFDVTCVYCGIMFSLVEDDDYPDEMFDTQNHLERECPQCHKKLSIEVDAIYSYTADRYESEDLND